jgi:hypothetical protein
MTAFADQLPASGTLAVERIPNPRPTLRQLSYAELLYHGLPRAGQPTHVREWKTRQANTFLRGLRGVKAARKVAAKYGLMAPYGLLWLQKITAQGEATDFGLVSTQIITTDGVDYIANDFAATASYEVDLFKFHGIGTGAVAAAVGDRALGTELTTQYQTDNTRPTGTQVKGATGIYSTVGTITVDASVAATEWGLFTQAATGAQSQPANSMLDRVVYSVVNLASGDSLQATFTLTFPNGG